MAVERYRRGRSYTARHYASADLDDPEAMLTVMEEMAASDPTVEGRLADAERRAMAHLAREKMPLDPHGPPYGDPAWLRENERRSATWYAVNILIVIRTLRKLIERGDARLAADIALDLGILATEAKMIQYMASNPAEAGKAKASAQRAEVERQHTRWLAEAGRLWAKPAKRKWGARAIAKEIDPSKVETIRKVIAGRKPRQSSG
jgi:hypothetical protein